MPKLRLTAIFALGSLLLGGAVSAQEVFSFREEMDFDRPESWALKTFSSASLMTSVGAPQKLAPWSWVLEAELGTIPHLDSDQRRVGFNGLKDEDLNRSPVLVRPRITLGLPRGFSATLAWVPPIELDGVETNIVSLALRKDLWRSDRASLGLRLFGQVGTSEGDFTCTDEDVAFAPGSPENAFGCNAPSEDEAQLNHYGLAILGGINLPTAAPLELHWGLYGTHMDLEFQVNAPVFGNIDQTLLVTDGETFAATVGLGGMLREKVRWGVEAFYSPLEVQRPEDATPRNDDFFNVRVMASVPLR